LAELISSNGETTNPARNLPSKKIAECRLGASGQQAVEKRYAIMFASSAGEFVGQIADVYPVGNDGSVITKDREGTLWKGTKYGYAFATPIPGRSAWNTLIDR
jgi:hypothetical protein